MQSTAILEGYKEAMPMQINLTSDETTSRYIASKEHLFSELKSEGVILSLANGKYYGINEVGVTIWKNIQKPTSIKEIQSAVMSEYDVEIEKCHQEILNFLTDMSKEGLVEVLNEEDK